MPSEGPLHRHGLLSSMLRHGLRLSVPLWRAPTPFPGGTVTARVAPSGRGESCQSCVVCVVCFLPSCALPELTASPNRPEGASMMQGVHEEDPVLLFSVISDRVNHKCISAATRAAMDRPMARVVSLVAQRAKSAVLLSSEMSSDLTCSPSSSSFSRSAWYACNTYIVCRHAPA